jgi:hypothetical protein
MKKPSLSTRKRTNGEINLTPLPLVFLLGPSQPGKGLSS